MTYGPAKALAIDTFDRPSDEEWEKQVEQEMDDLAARLAKASERLEGYKREVRRLRNRLEEIMHQLGRAGLLGPVDEEVS